MKNKLSKIFGVGLTIALLASLLVVAPVALNAGNLTYEVVATPSAKGKVLTAGTNIDFLLTTADGATQFAYDNTSHKLVKSTNSGKTFAAATTSANLTNDAVVAMAISPNFATDGVIVAATAATVLISVDGGKTFVTGPAITLGAGGAITSVDLGAYYATNVLNILVGVAGNGGAITSNVLRFPLSGSFAWVSVGALTEDVRAVKFTPNHIADAEIIAVSTNGTHTNVNSQFGTLTWNNAGGVPQKTLFTGVATSAVIAIGSDFMGSGSGQIYLVGTNGSTVDDVYRVSQSFASASTVSRLNISGASPATDSNIQSIAIQGATASPVLVAVAGLTTVSRTPTPVGTVTWSTSTGTKSPTGAGGVTKVLWAGTTAYAGTTGLGSALSTSADGNNWNQLSLIDVGTIANITLVTSDVVDANTIFLILNNSTGAYAAAMRSVFKTTDGGATWQRILTNTNAAIVDASPNYATDSAVYLANGTNVVSKSTDGGMSFIPVGVPANVTALKVTDKDVFYVGATASFYKGGRFNVATGITAATDVKSIAFSGTTILVGNNAGSVFISTDDGLTFTMVGAAGSLGAGYTVYVAADPAFATNSTIYAGSTNTTAGLVKRATATTTSATWTTIDTDTNTLIVNGLVADGGALYAASGKAGKGIRRSIDPLTAVDATAGTAPTFESMVGTTTTMLAATTVLANLSVVSATKTLYGIDTMTAAASDGSYGYTGRLLAITDTLNAKATTTSPKQTVSAGVELIPALTTPTSATLVWAAMTGATAYEVKYSTTATFTATTTTTSAGVTTTSLAVTGLTSGVTYYWKVRATAPVASLSSDVAKFYTALPAAAAPPVVYFPALGATGIAITPTFTWPMIAGATSYDFAIGEDPTFKIIDFADTTALPAVAIPATEPLKYNTTYYWRVRGTTGAVVGAGGGAAQAGAYQVLSFTTMAEPVVVEEPEPVQVIIKEPGENTITTIEIPKVETVVIPQPIPSYLLWAIIGIGAILVIALIILIVRTRRVA